MSVRVVALTACVVAMVLPASVRAQTTDAGTAASAGATRVTEAQQHLTAAMAAFRTHDYSTSIHEFELAIRAAPNADLWYNLARARELSGDAEGAIGDYRRYLRDKVDPPDAEVVQRHIGELQSLAEHQAAARRRQAEGARVRFQVEGATAQRSAQLFLDGAEVSLAALTDPLRVTPGEHDVQVTAEGAQAWRARVRVRDGETATVFATLTAATRYATRPVPHVASAILAGLGLVSFGVAAYFGVEAGSSRCRGCPEQVNAASRSDILLGVGASLAVGAAVAFFLERASGRTERVLDAR